MQMNLKSEIKCKPHSASFTSLQINESFNHFRSVSYFEAVANASLSGSRKSFENYAGAGRPKHTKLSSNSTPCTPKRIEIGKYSTLPVAQYNTGLPGKKARSSSLSSFFRKLRPKFHRSSSESKNPWIVIEFSPHNNDDGCSDDSDKSDNSLEMAVKSKVQHFTSLKDLYENSSDLCNCALSNKRKDNNSVSPKCNFNSFSASKTSDSFGHKSQKGPSKYKSESSILFRLSPRRRFENLKQMLKRLSNYSRYKNSASLPSLNSKSHTYKSDTCIKNHSFTNNTFPSNYNQFDNGRSISPVFHFCKPTNQDFFRSSRSTDFGLLKLPTSRSVNTSLSSVLEDNSLRRVQPPKTLSLCSKNFRDQQVLKFYQKMASVESIGACSLDFETSATDNFLTRKDLTASECTLHSTNGLTPSIKESSRNGLDLQEELLLKEQRLSADAKNGLKPGDKKEYTVAEIKLPSYVSISCAINGYTNYSRFCRSRDNSPARTSFRKSSFEPSMLSDMNGKEPHSMDSNFRYSRSQSDCNGRMHSVYTESKHVTVSKQLQIPIKSTRKYMTEVTITNGHNEAVERTESPSSKDSVTNGHENEPLALAKEVGNSGTKSLVQQRIESLYGKSASEEIKVTVKPPLKRQSFSTCESSNSSQSPSIIEKPHKASVSPPVFRHLNKDFRKQLQGNIVDDKKTDSEKLPKPVKKTIQNHLKSNGVSSLSNGMDIDECDRAKSKTPPPKLSDVSFEQKRSFSNGASDEDREGYKFLNLIDIEKDKILSQVRIHEEELQKNSTLPEEASGKIRAACGKANLLISQKFEQFKGLCWKNIEDSPNVPFYTSASDLAGFWDLVTLQIDDINSTFKEIELLRENNWKEVPCQKKYCQKSVCKTLITRGPPNMVLNDFDEFKPVSEVKARSSSSKNVSRSNPSTPKRSTKSAELAKAREEARKQLLAAKKKGRQQNSSNDSEVAIFTPASNS